MCLQTDLHTYFILKWDHQEIIPCWNRPTEHFLCIILRYLGEVDFDSQLEESKHCWRIDMSCRWVKYSDKKIESVESWSPSSDIIKCSPECSVNGGSMFTRKAGRQQRGLYMCEGRSNQWKPKLLIPKKTCIMRQVQVNIICDPEFDLFL